MAHHSEEQQTNIEYDRPLLTTLGKCISDDLYLPNGENKSRVLGGDGVYSILGAHLFFSDAESQETFLVNQSWESISMKDCREAS